MSCLNTSDAMPFLHNCSIINALTERKERKMELRREGGKERVKMNGKSKEGKKRNIQMQLPARIVTVEIHGMKDSEAREGQLQV